MRDIVSLAQDVRISTCNTDVNGVTNREIDRYFADGVKAIQALIFKNNPLCSYFQEYKVYELSDASGRTYTLPSDCYALNAVSMVEIENNGKWIPIDRVWPEDGISFFGWYTRNKTVVISGDPAVALGKRVRVSYFQRVPKPARSIGVFSAYTANNISLAVQLTAEQAADYTLTDRYITLVNSDGTIQQTDVRFQFFVASANPAIYTYTTITAGMLLREVCMGPNSTFVIDLPDECEPYLMDYVAQRIAGRNNYTEEWNKLNYWTAEERGNIIAIFADASQAQTRAPLTDTDYMRV